MNTTTAGTSALGLEPRKSPSAIAARMILVRSAGPIKNAMAVNSSAAEATST